MDDRSYTGWRFHLACWTSIGYVGGHFVREFSDDGSFFAAILRLDSPTAYPWAAGSPAFSGTNLLGTTDWETLGQVIADEMVCTNTTT
ncbi:MAG: hypothetical protein DME26_06100 [Verrucomicrobia bacterium]|nr:MAG: hypothetical protein DME26_06100 [Verrucomicrobiota bacterium]